jgi:hypothetical protein
MNGRAFLLLAIVLAAASALACTRPWHPPADGEWPPPTPTPSCPNQTCGSVPFETVSQQEGAFGLDGVLPELHVIRDAAAWEQLWSDESTRPQVDFSGKIVIVVEDAWAFPGDSLRIDGISADPSGLTVEATRTLTGQMGCFGVTSGHHIVSIPWTALPAQLDLTFEFGPCFV